MPAAFEPPPRTLRDHLALLRRRGAVLAAVVVVAVAAALIASLVQERRYVASAEVLVQQEPVTVEDPFADQRVEEKRLDPARVMQDEVKIANGQAVRDRVREAIGTTPSVVATGSKDTDVITFTATSDDANQAARAANAYADAFRSERRDGLVARASASQAALASAVATIDERMRAIEATLAAPLPGDRIEQLTSERDTLASRRDELERALGAATVAASLADEAAPLIVNPAAAPAAPASPATARNVVLALLAGLLVGVAAAYAVDELDDRVRTVDDLERLCALPAVGTVTLDRGDHATIRALARDDPLVTSTDLRVDVPVAPDRDAGARAVCFLLVTAGTRGRAVRRSMAMLGDLGVTLAGAILGEPGDMTGSAAPANAAGTAAPREGTEPSGGPQPTRDAVGDVARP